MKRRDFLNATLIGAALPTMPQAPQRSDKELAHLKSMTANVKPLDAGDYERRIEKARGLMRQQNIAALYLNPGTSMRYFTGVQWGLSERMFASVIPTNGELIYLCPGFEEQRAREQIKIGRDIRPWQEHEDPYTLVRKSLADREIVTGNIGIEPTVRYFVLDGLTKAAPGLRFVSGKPISDGCRMVKDAKELEYMLLANRITKEAYRAALKTLRERMSQEELAGTIARAYSILGARGFAAVSFGPNSAFPHGSMVRRNLREGDVVLVDDGCTVEGYQSDVTRTVVFGKPSQKQLEVFNIVHEAQAAARQAARAGGPCEAVDAAARGVIEKAGYGPDYKYFTHRVGHGIGMDGHEEPYLVRGNKLRVLPGMTFSDEPGIYIYGEFGIRLEDIIRITEDGCEFLGETQDAIDKP